MEVRVWQSFSANNSGRFYLVGEFGSASVANRVSDELRAYLRELRSEPAAHDANGLTPSWRRFAEAHDLEFRGPLVDGDADDEEIEVLTVGDQLLVFHEYGLGFTRGLPEYVEASGGSIPSGASTLFRTPTLSVLVELADGDAPLQELRRGLMATDEYDIHFFDGHWGGVVAPRDPEGISEVRELLAERGLTNYSMAVDRHHLAHRFAAMASEETRVCKACGAGELRYLPSFAFGTEVDQIACQACGGMFDAGGFFEDKVVHLYFDPSASPRCFDPLVRERFLVGRSPAADLSFRGRGTIARHHCELRREDDGDFVLADLGGTNGTMLNGVRLSGAQRLADGDLIGLPDDTVLRVELADRG